MHITSPNHTTMSDAEQPGAEQERRSTDRVQTVLLVARVIAEHDQGLARLRNVSDRGMGLQLQIPVLLGDAITVDLGEGMTVNGRVMWTCGQECGLRLDEEIDSAALLGELAARSRRGRARAVRLPVEISAMTSGDNGMRRVEVKDVSQRGMKLKHDGSLTEGLQLKIILSSGKERRGVVRWSRDNVAGLMLLEPFSTEDLGSISNL